MRTPLLSPRPLRLPPAFSRSAIPPSRTYSTSAAPPPPVAPSNARPFAAPEELSNVRNYCRQFIHASLTNLPPSELSRVPSGSPHTHRTHDYPSHILTPFLPPSIHDSYLAIKSFNLATSLVSEHSSSLPVAQLRMKFWRDAIDAIYTSDDGTTGRRYKEPTMVLLGSVLRGGHLDERTGQVVEGKRLNKGWFVRNISARESLFPLTPFPTLASLETYSENAYSSLQYLLLESLSIYSPTHDHIASHIGKALGIAAILRGVPLMAFPSPPTSPAQVRNTFYHNPFGGGAPRGVVLLPVEVCAKHGLRQEDVLREGGAAKGLKDVIFEIATRANDHLLTADMMIKDARDKKELGMGADWGTFMSAVPTKKFLKRLEKVDFDIFDKSLSKKDWLLPWSAYWAYRKGEF
ncbi:Squalene/phytoene synthase-domain-containing protein [Kalaharituber pfeilii]|nr:Squalene/phytoene synthase-domain-containing protein [Kalaharituber pfeilii]